MIPANVMSFINKITAVNSGGSDETSVRGLLRNTLINAQDMVTASSRRNSSSVISDCNNTTLPQSEQSTTNLRTNEESSSSLKETPNKRTGSCRVCLKSLNPNDFFQVCFECKMKVCEDCASYSQFEDETDKLLWLCSVCRRKQQRVQEFDNLLDIPTGSDKHRRYSDIKIDSLNSNSEKNFQGGLDPLRCADSRRHSDVSPAILKELKKAANKNNEKIQRDQEFRRRQKQQTNTTQTNKGFSTESSRMGFSNETDSEKDNYKRGFGDTDIIVDNNNEERKIKQGSHSSMRVIKTNLHHGVSSSDTDILRKQSSLSREDIKIVIDHVDREELEQSSSEASFIRRVILKKNPNEKIHKATGFGMRLDVAKSNHKGTLYTYVVRVMPGGSAEKAQLKKGDKILELCGIPLIDLTLNEVASIMNQVGDIIDIIVETKTATKMCNIKNDNYINETEIPKLTLSPTRRMLPKIPIETDNKQNQDQTKGKSTQITEQQISRLQLEFRCKEKKSVLIVSILAADNLPMRNNYCLGSNQPEAYVRLCLLPQTKDKNQFVFSDVAEPNQNPIWNTTLELYAEDGNILEKSLEVTVWDQRPDGEHVLIGEVIIGEIDLSNDTPVWYRVDNPKITKVKKSNKYFLDSPTTSFEQNTSEPMKDNEFEEENELVGFLHPSHAYLTSYRRGSSLSEQLEIEPYQLSRDFSKSLPGSRRNSFQSVQNDEKDISQLQLMHCLKGRRQSLFTSRSDPDEILKNLKPDGDILPRSNSICSSNWYNKRK